MKIGRKLTLNAFTILFLMIAIGATAVIGIKFIQSKVSELTQKSTPYQIKVFSHQRVLQAHAANLVKVAASDSMEEFKTASAAARESLQEEAKAAENVARLSANGSSSVSEIADITKSIIGTTEKRIEGQQATLESTALMRRNLTEASKRLNALDSTIRKLQQDSTDVMVLGVDKAIDVNQQANSLIIIRDGFKDLIISISRFMALNDRRSATTMKENIETTANHILQAVKTAKLSGKSGEELEKRVKDMTSKLTGAVNMKLKYFKEEDESLKAKSEKIAKDAEYELTYMLPTVLQEYERGNAQMKFSTQNISKNLKSFTATNNVLITSSALMSLTAFIDSNINYSLSLRNVQDFGKAVETIRSAFEQAEKVHYKLSELTAGYSNALQLCKSSYDALKIAKQGFLGKDGAAEKMRTSLNNVEEVARLNQKMKETVTKRIQDTSKAVSGAQANQEKSVAAVKSTVNTTIMVILVIASVAVLASILINRWIAASILKPVKELETLAEGFGNGDFNSKIDDKRKDEFGRLAVHFNQSSQKLSEIISHLADSIKKLASSSGDLSRTAEQLYEVAETQVTQTDQSATAISEISQTITSVSQNAGDASDASREALKKAANGKDIVEQTVVRMQEIADSVRETASTINSLSESSEKIGAIVSMINDIADQTNLLALNAAIEAARAGDQGRGFAVVADEVRQLAERTTNATEEIAVIIHAIHDSTGRSVAAMGIGRGKVEEGVRFAGEASRSLQEIVAASQKGVDLAQMIAAATVQQSTASEHVARNMGNIKMITSEMENSISLVKKEAEDLSKLAAELNTMASWFKIMA